MLYACYVLQAPHPAIRPPVGEAIRWGDRAMVRRSVKSREREPDAAVVDGQDSCHLR